MGVGEESSMSVSLFWIGMSVFSSVSLIITIKYIMSTYDFKFVFCLTTCHFTCQLILLESFALLGAIKSKRLPFFENWLCALAMVFSVAFMNFSLNANSVGFYQVTKLCTVPLMVVVQTVVYGKTFSRRIKLTLCFVLLGVGMAVVTDFQLNGLGMVYGAIAITSTTLYQIWTGEKQAKYGIDGKQFQHSQSSALAMTVGTFALVFEVLAVFTPADVPNRSILTHEFQKAEVILIFFSCLLAISVNISTANVIKHTSPVTYQVVGHAKTCLILIGGFTLFPIPGDVTPAGIAKNVLGILVAMSGVILYGNLKMAAQKGTGDVCTSFCAGTWFVADTEETLNAKSRLSDESEETEMMMSRT